MCSLPASKSLGWPKDWAPGVPVEGAHQRGRYLTLPARPARPPATERWRLIVPRRLFSKNGVEYLVRAMPYIVAQVDAEAVLIGDGPERTRLEELARELGVADRLSFMGKQPSAAMPGLLSSGDLAVFPSLMEATSVAALEAMACELPVAASRVGGLPGDRGRGGRRTVRGGRPEKPGRVRGRVARIGAAGGYGQAGTQPSGERWSNDRLAERHLELYRSLLARRGATDCWGSPRPFREAFAFEEECMKKRT